jgi:hypothetical protein
LRSLLYRKTFVAAETECSENPFRLALKLPGRSKGILTTRVLVHQHLALQFANTFVQSVAQPILPAPCTVLFRRTAANATEVSHRALLVRRCPSVLLLLVRHGVCVSDILYRRHAAAY